MPGVKGKSGGARPGAGRPSVSKKNANKRLCVSDESYDILTYQSNKYGLSRSDIVDILCKSNLYDDLLNSDK